MTNLTSPAAEPAMGFPNSMPDIIDSLKRLERIGDEQSKTIQKILDAARDVEAAIVLLYEGTERPLALSGSAILTVLASNKGETPENVAKSLGVDYARAARMKYQLGGGPKGSELYDGTGRQVSDSRGAALAFASDLAAGFLELLIHDLLHRQAENVRALDILSNARDVLDRPF